MRWTDVGFQLPPARVLSPAETTRDSLEREPTFPKLNDPTDYPLFLRHLNRAKPVDRYVAEAAPITVSAAFGTDPFASPPLAGIDDSAPERGERGTYTSQRSPLLRRSAHDRPPSAWTEPVQPP